MGCPNDGLLLLNISETKKIPDNPNVERIVSGLTAEVSGYRETIKKIEQSSLDNVEEVTPRADMHLKASTYDLYRKLQPEAISNKSIMVDLSALAEVGKDTCGSQEGYHDRRER